MNRICWDCEYKNVPSLDLPCCICDKFDNYPNTKIIEVLNSAKTRIKFSQHLQQGEGDFYNGMEIASNNDLNIIDSIIDSVREETVNLRDNELSCDRNICAQNEYNNIGCEDCVVMKGKDNVCN